MTSQTVAQQLVDAMARQGISVVFGTVGHGNLPLVDAIAGDPRIEFVTTYHEQVAIHAADAYYRASEQVAGVITTVGPGATNLTTGLGDALLDSSAVVVITGGVPSTHVRRDPLQALSVSADNTQSEIFRPLTKRVYSVSSSSDLVPEFVRAYSESINGRPGPVLLHVPLDFFSAAAEADVVVRSPQRFTPYPDTGSIVKAAEMLRRAKRPLIYAGGGALTGDAPAQIKCMSQNFGIPVATTMSGQGAIDESAAMSLGTTGVVGTRTGNTAVREADVILAVGTGFPEMDASSWRPEFFAEFPPTKLVHVDIDAKSINRVFPADIGINADAGATLYALSESLSENAPDYTAWGAHVQELKQSWKEEISEVRETDAVPFEPGYILTRLRALLPEDAVVISGVGVRHAVAQHYPVRRPRTLIVASGFGTMGQEVAAPIGVKAALPDTPVVGVIGDGALLACLAALPTAQAAGKNIVWVVLDNGGYASIAVYQAKHFGRQLGTDFVTSDGEEYLIDYAALAESFGIWSTTVESGMELQDKIQEALTRPGPALVVVPVTSRPRVQGTGHWDVNDIFAAGAEISRGKANA